MHVLKHAIILVYLYLSIIKYMYTHNHCTIVCMYICIHVLKVCETWSAGTGHKKKNPVGFFFCCVSIFAKTESVFFYFYSLCFR